MNDVSPELALVDDALAERERGLLPEPDDCLAPRPAAAATPVAPPPPPTLTLLSPAPEPGLAEVEPEVAPSTRDELRVAGIRSLALAEPPVAQAPAPPEDLAPAEPAPRVEPAPAAEPPPAETVVAVAEPVEDVAPEAEEREEAPVEPAPAVPTRMPEWVASDVPPKSRRARRKDRARSRRDARRERPRAGRRRVAVAASWIVLCGFLASPLLAFIPSPSGERPTLAPDGVASVPDAGDETGHALRWDPVAKAAGYSVVFVNDGVRSDRWSQSAELRLPAGTENEQLVTYEWFVYPAFRDGAGYRYGPLVASGEVTMPKLAPTESS